MWMLVGLGNPGDKYKHNRHNIGFMAIDAITGHYNLGPMRSKFQGEYCEGRVAGEKIVCLKPLTYMNESGQSVRKASDFYKIEPDRIVVFHDELDIAPALFRMKKGGGNAGHNGLKSVQAHLGTPDFLRARMGIGHPGHKDRVSPYVLSDFAKSEAAWVDEMNNSIAKHLELLIGNHMNDFASKVGMDLAALTKNEEG